MALLTAEDVLNKAFSKTKYREGFDQDEVDDFLDEVAHTISSLLAERDDLAQRLAQAQAQPGLPTAPESDNLLQAATDPTPPSATGMLVIAQRLHDEYVAAGEEEKVRILEEAKSKAESIVEQAETDAKNRMDELQRERGALESKIDDLRRFERDYRSRLKNYLENLLGDIDHGGESSPSQTSVGGPATGGVNLAAAAAAVSAPVEEVSVEAEGKSGPTPSPWAQVRDQSAGSAPEIEDAAPAWGGAQVSQRLDTGDDHAPESLQDSATDDSAQR